MKKKEQVQPLCALGWDTSDLSNRDPDLKCLKRMKKWAISILAVSAALLSGWGRVTTPGFCRKRGPPHL